MSLSRFTTTDSLINPSALGVKYWDIASKAYRQELNDAPAYYRESKSLILDLVRVVGRSSTCNPLHILDLGSGVGADCLDIQEALPNAVVVGVDFSPEMTKFANESFSALKSPRKPIAVTHDIFSLVSCRDVCSRKFDVVLCSLVLHHYSEESVLSLFQKVLDYIVDGGLLVVSDLYARNCKLIEEFLLYREIASVTSGSRNAPNHRFAATLTSDHYLSHSLSTLDRTFELAKRSGFGHCELLRSENQLSVWVGIAKSHQAAELK